MCTTTTSKILNITASIISNLLVTLDLQSQFCHWRWLWDDSWPLYSSVSVFVKSAANPSLRAIVQREQDVASKVPGTELRLWGQVLFFIALQHKAIKCLPAFTYSQTHKPRHDLHAYSMLFSSLGIYDTWQKLCGLSHWDLWHAVHLLAEHRLVYRPTRRSRADHQEPITYLPLATLLSPFKGEERPEMAEQLRLDPNWVDDRTRAFSPAKLKGHMLSILFRHQV